MKRTYKPSEGLAWVQNKIAAEKHYNIILNGTNQSIK